MKLMTVCYPNNAIMACKPKYDSRMTPVAIITAVNSGKISVPDDAGRIHFQAHGYLYTAIKNEHNSWVLEPGRIKAVTK